MVKKANITWTAKQVNKMYENGKMSFNNVVQRSLVWDKNRKSLFIHSLMTGFPTPPFYAKKDSEVYDMLDGKQRINTISSFINNGFVLDNIPSVTYEGDDGKYHTGNYNGFRFDDLNETLQDAILDYTFTIYYFDGITDAEVADMFFRLNNGKPLTQVELTRVKAHDISAIKQIAQHSIFKKICSEKAIEKYTNEDIAMKSLMMLTMEHTSLDGKAVRPFIEEHEITTGEKNLLSSIFDYMQEAHEWVNSRKVSKKMFTRLHFISLVPIVKLAMDNKVTADNFAEFVEDFYGSEQNVSINTVYNENCIAGVNHEEAVTNRYRALRESFIAHFASNDDTKELEDKNAE